MKSKLREASDDPRILHHPPHVSMIDLARLKAVLDEQSGSGGEHINKATEAYLQFLNRRAPLN